MLRDPDIRVHTNLLCTSRRRSNIGCTRQPRLVGRRAGCKTQRFHKVRDRGLRNLQHVQRQLLGTPLTWRLRKTSVVRGANQKLQLLNLNGFPSKRYYSVPPDFHSFQSKPPLYQSLNLRNIMAKTRIRYFMLHFPDFNNSPSSENSSPHAAAIFIKIR